MGADGLWVDDCMCVRDCLWMLSMPISVTFFLWEMEAKRI